MQSVCNIELQSSISSLNHYETGRFAMFGHIYDHYITFTKLLRLLEKGMIKSVSNHDHAQ